MKPVTRRAFCASAAVAAGTIAGGGRCQDEGDEAASDAGEGTGDEAG